MSLVLKVILKKLVYVCGLVSAEDRFRWLSVVKSNGVKDRGCLGQLVWYRRLKGGVCS